MTGCVSFDVDRNYSLAGKTDKGLLVVSVTQTGPIGCLRYNLRGITVSKDTFVMSCAPHSPPDWRSPRGRLSVIELPAGKYEFYKWSEVGTQYVAAKELFSAPFTIEARKANYIGNLHIQVTPERTTYNIFIRDRQDRDLPLFRSRFVNVDQKSITTNFAKVILEKN